MTTLTRPAPTPPQTPHSVHRDQFLAHAKERAAARDRLQASEKIWGAAAHALIDFARKRGWPLATHADFLDIARHIQRSARREDKAITRLYAVMEGHHRNFYSDTRSMSDIREGIAEAEEFLALIADADEKIPVDAPPPYGKDFSRYARKYGPQAAP